MRQLIEELQTQKTSEKVRALQHFFENALDADKLWIIALFTGRRPKRAVKISQLRLWAAEYTGIPHWLFEESYAIVGDLAETIALLIHHDQPTKPFSLHEYMEALQTVKKLPEEEQKQWIFEAWNQLDRTDRFLFNKLLTGGFRIGVSMALIVQALEKATGTAREDLHFRLSGTWDPYQTTYQHLILNPYQTDNPSKPYPFCLAYPLEEPENLLPLSQWQCEFKWDGIRGQLIKREHTITLWSRGEEIITPSFPDIANIMERSRFDGVLDGEIISWDFERNLPKPFADLQKRLGRKSPGKAILSSHPCTFIAYDLLEYQGKDLRELPLKERRILLEKALENDFPNTPNTATLLLSETLQAETVSALEGLRQQAKLTHTEGLMIKKRDSPYGTGRKRGDWWKWKLAPETIDAVMIYAQKGHGRRASRYTDFTFALRNGAELVPFAKAYSGLTQKEIEEVNGWIKDHTRERFGPVCSVKAELVFEIAFEGIQRSTRHKSGIAVRFPRISRWRKDKTVSEIDTLEEVLLKYGLG
jgi:DNA ligase 1